MSSFISAWGTLRVIETTDEFKLQLKIQGVYVSYGVSSNNYKKPSILQHIQKDVGSIIFPSPLLQAQVIFEMCTCICDTLKKPLKSTSYKHWNIHVYLQSYYYWTRKQRGESWFYIETFYIIIMWCNILWNKILGGFCLFEHLFSTICKERILVNVHGVH